MGVHSAIFHPKGAYWVPADASVREIEYNTVIIRHKGIESCPAGSELPEITQEQIYKLREGQQCSCLYCRGD